MVDLLRNIAFVIVFYGLSVPVVLATPIAALFGKRVLRAVCMSWARLGVWSARHILGIRIVVEGQQSVAGPALYPVKHQAMFETMAVAAMLGAPAIVMKRELAQVPVWGWAARRYGVIVVDRAANAGALRQMMREAKAALAEGRSVLLFPEGTRVAPGETPPIRSGFAGLYRALGLPVIPVALDSGRLWPRRGLKRPGIVTFRFGAPIAPGLERSDVEAQVHRGINALES